MTPAIMTQVIRTATGWIWPKEQSYDDYHVILCNMNDYYYDDIEELGGNEPIMLEELAEHVSRLAKNMDTGMAELLECLAAVEQIALQGDDDMIYGSFIAQLAPQVLKVVTPLLGEQTRSIASTE